MSSYLDLLCLFFFLYLSLPPPGVRLLLLDSSLFSFWFPPPLIIADSPFRPSLIVPTTGELPLEGFGVHTALLLAVTVVEAAALLSRAALRLSSSFLRRESMWDSNSSWLGYIKKPIKSFLMVLSPKSLLFSYCINKSSCSNSLWCHPPRHPKHQTKLDFLAMEFGAFEPRGKCKPLQWSLEDI